MEDLLDKEKMDIYAKTNQNEGFFIDLLLIKFGKLMTNDDILKKIYWSKTQADFVKNICE